MRCKLAVRPAASLRLRIILWPQSLQRHVIQRHELLQPALWHFVQPTHHRLPLLDTDPIVSFLPSPHARQVRDLVDQVVVVPDSAIVQAMQLIFERMKLVVEPSGAAGLAAVLSPGFSQALQRCKRDGSSAQEAAVNGAAMGQPCGKNVGIILCGGNLDFESKGFFKMENWKAHA